MNKFFLILGLCCIANIMPAQDRLLKKANSALKENDLNGALDLLNSYEAKAGHQAESRFLNFLINISGEKTIEKMDEAWMYLNYATENYESLPEKDKNKWCKEINFCEPLFPYYRGLADSLIYVTYKTTNNIEAITNFLKKYKQSAWKKQAAEFKSFLAFNETVALNTQSGYLTYLKNYSSYPFADSARSLLWVVAFNSANDTNTVESYNLFINNYPKAPQIFEAKRKLYGLIWNSTLASNRKKDYLDFISNYPEADQISLAKHKVEDFEWNETVAKGSIKKYEKFIASYPNSEHLSEARTNLEDLRRKREMMGANIQEELHEVNIGEQTWSDKNLNTNRFNNGDLIPQAKTAEEWKNANLKMQPAWCYFKNDTANGSKLGKLYNWYAVSDPRGIAPDGWRVPIDSDWKQLVNYLGGDYDRRSSESEPAKKMKSKIGWGSFKDGGGTELEYCPSCGGSGKVQSENEEDYGRFYTCSRCRGEGMVYVTYSDETKSGSGDNQIGFSAIAASWRDKDGGFGGEGTNTSWWSSTECYTLGAWFCDINIKNGIRKLYGSKGFGFSVRCIKGDEPEEKRMPDEVSIGSQVWSTRNLNVDTFRNGDPIPQASTAESWLKAGEMKQPAWCYYKNSHENGIFYGKLYNWYAVSDPRGLAPVGWHIPSDSEWVQINNFLKTDVAKQLKSTCGWGWSIFHSDNPNDKSGFAGLPGGYRSSYSETIEYQFRDLDENGYWWSSTPSPRDSNSVISIRLYGDERKYDFSNKIARESTNRGHGLSVRCVKDPVIK